ncbi:Na/Pi cotransporter family protein [Hespellia stercorisuis]|uniref:Phosphate:Na+ symporter n=1 Tax=Hespellia stercorisuis DSM 15480 TaxID=1121950 RepID=A0A1M6KCV1_9FIRM|nr:Na/Pi cotransporter family protein [Hespellia stercorisuis]SHJ56657.1 phosphate:Na+ symporter [Hespellia stercorisuis DSM 15480]
MNITDIFGLLGGLALFLYGMQMMSAGMEAAAGNRMKQILEKLTANRFLGVAVGAGITAVIQSSSATTVMVVGFVNSGMMTLRQAVWIIMGANIGTTITGQLIALDVGAIAPLIAFVGVVMVAFMKKPKYHHIGSILAGLGILFIGMDMMSTAMMPLRESQTFIHMMTSFSNPLLGILAGAAFTAVIQSSSASVGILQALARSGIIPFSSAVYVLFGQNIGTCITALLASIGTSRSAKRTTIIHLSFNIIGTVIFTVATMVLPLTEFVAQLTPGNPPAQIANMHTLFNIVTTAMLLPFGNYLADLAEHLLPDREEAAVQPVQEQKLQYLNMEAVGRQIGSLAIYTEQIRQESGRMMELARENVREGFEAFRKKDVAMIEAVEQREDLIDYLNKEISNYISRALAKELEIRESRTLSGFFKITGNIERIGDHAMNICGYARMLDEKAVKFSKEEKQEQKEIQRVSEAMLSELLICGTERLDDLTRISAMEQRIDDMTERYRNHMLERMRRGTCSEEGCILYSEMLTDFERIGDHALNISQELAKIHILQQKE